MSKLRTIVITSALVFPLGLLAGPMKGHPNLIAADKALGVAWQRISDAQAANEFDLGGHAEKAKAAIEVAVAELALAARAANATK